MFFTCMYFSFYKKLEILIPFFLILKKNIFTSIYFIYVIVLGIIYVYVMYVYTGIVYILHLCYGYLL